MGYLTVVDYRKLTIQLRYRFCSRVNNYLIVRKVHSQRRITDKDVRGPELVVECQKFALLNQSQRRETGEVRVVDSK